MSLSEYLPTSSTYDRLLNSIPQSVRDVMNQPSLANRSQTAWGDNLLVPGSKAYVTSNSKYRVILVQNTSSLGNSTVIANAPSDFELSLQNNYISLMDIISTTLGSALMPTDGKLAALATGAGIASGYGQPIAASVQVWTGITPSSFTLPLSFRAYKDPKTEVIDPLRTLLKMSSPAKVAGGAFMRAPGPNLWNILEGLKGSAQGAAFLLNLPNAITMYFGRNIVVPGLVVDNIAVKMYNRAERKSGLPIACEVTVGLRTIVAYSGDDVLAAFYSNNPAGGFGMGGVLPSAASRAAGGLQHGFDSRKRQIFTQQLLRERQLRCHRLEWRAHYSGAGPVVTQIPRVPRTAHRVRYCRIQRPAVYNYGVSVLWQHDIDMAGAFIQRTVVENRAARRHDAQVPLSGADTRSSGIPACKNFRGGAYMKVWLRHVSKHRRNLGLKTCCNSNPCG